MYAPEDFPEDAYHRYLYVYVCKDGACHIQNWRHCVKVLRCQMGINNNFYNTDPETEETQFKSQVESHTALCFVCGLRGTKRCSSCSQLTYCSKQHQGLHWTQGLHKQICPLLQHHKEMNSSALKELEQQDQERMRNCGALYAEGELISEPEKRNTPTQSSINLYGSHNITLGALNMHTTPLSIKSTEDSNVEDDEDDDDDKACEESETGVDHTFLQFQKRMLMNPGQVLRYVRTAYDGNDSAVDNQSDNSNLEVDEKDDDDKDEENTTDTVGPLYVCDKDQPNVDKIPPCPICCTPRTLEFQILSTLLNHLGIDHTDGKALDFGTYLIYSCPNSCSIPIGSSYVDEVVYRQQFSSDGMESFAKHRPPSKIQQ